MILCGLLFIHVAGGSKCFRIMASTQLKLTQKWDSDRKYRKITVDTVELFSQRFESTR